MAFLNGARLVLAILFLAAMVMISISRVMSRLSETLFRVYPENWNTVAVVTYNQDKNSSLEEKSSYARLLENQTTLNADVCFFGDTRLFLTETATDVFVNEILTFLGKVALRSFNEALSEGKIHVMIPLHQVKPHFNHWTEVDKFIRPLIADYEHLNVDFSPRAFSSAANFFGRTKCSWVVAVKLDADDVLAPGYLDWIVKDVIPTLKRGAVVASRRLPRLNYGYKRCNSDPTEGVKGKLGFDDTCPYWSGWSVGQTRIFRREVFKALKMPFESVAHALALTFYRRDVITEILKEKPPWFFKRDFKHAKRWHLFRRSDKIMEKKTGIKMIDSVEAGFGPSGIYMKTPLSSHFPFGRLNRLPKCTPAKWIETIANATRGNTVKGKYEYLYEWGQHSNLTRFDNCVSSYTVAARRPSEVDIRVECEHWDQQTRKALGLPDVQRNLTMQGGWRWSLSSLLNRNW